MDASGDTVAIGVRQCASCGAALPGPYCAECGEQRLEPDAMTLRHFLVHTAGPELFSVDGALWRTLRLLFIRPGQLALEYAAGRRRPFLNPFRLLLIAIVAYTVMTATAGFGVTLGIGPVTLSMAPPVIQRNRPVGNVLEQVDPYGLLQRAYAARHAELQGERARQRFNDRLAMFVQPASFTNVFLLAAVLHLGFRWKRRPFLEHAALSMHVVSFVLLSGLILFGLGRVRDLLPLNFFLTIGLFALWQFIYLALAIRRVYLADVRWGRALAVAAAVIIYVLNAFFITAVQLAGASIALALA